MKIIIIITSFTLLICIGILLLYKNQSVFIFFPEKIPKNYVYMFNHSLNVSKKNSTTQSLAGEDQFLEINLSPEKEVSLNCLEFYNKKNSRTIIFFHGNAGNLIGWGEISKEFLDLHYNFFICDYREFGKSTGKITEEALLKDSLFIYDFVKNKYPDQKLLVYGMSIGTAFATYIGSKRTVDKVILECPFYNFEKVVQFHYPFVPKFLINFKFPIDEWIKSIQSPVFIFHGTSDSIIPIENSEELKNKFPEKIQYLKIQYGDHNNLRGFEEFRADLKKILTY